ncbi:branched-chain amino acid ABC transporter permease [Aquibacillus koreensis]|uniref:Branched-chain amino acid ABC transporter permease n=1 Tax=Aquibacillus koreensis TaxID=279446 RepID=A0A9X3WM51_9BACI|nr:branched-chain amino acid ABC transporter permease [Aquibacillus koreensis]MCT2537153.1 branched-chain amino acid ABC transporter permease [Aquibacillus koreensis]MDC3419864.1 branched-chain amino acid ABC transporter permease [Aquibacillus koreensis]
MSLSILSVVLLNIVTSIAIFFVIAVGLAVIFGLMDVVNLAHGEFVMLGAYAAFITSQLGLNPWLSFVIAPVIVAIFGLFIEKILIRHLYGKIMESILATWGLGIILRQVIELIFGKDYKIAPYPVEQTVNVFGAGYPVYRLLIVVLALVIVALLWYLERKTNVGVTVRAVIQNPNLSSALGININRVYSISFVVGSALAGLAGAIIAPLVSVHSGMGINYVMNGFLTVLVGGMGSLFGLVGSASLLGGSESVFSFFFDPVWGSIAVILITIVFMRFKKTSI